MIIEYNVESLRLCYGLSPDTEKYSLVSFFCDADELADFPEDFIFQGNPEITLFFAMLTCTALQRHLPISDLFERHSSLPCVGIHEQSQKCWEGMQRIGAVSIPGNMGKAVISSLNFCTYPSFALLGKNVVPISICNEIFSNMQHSGLHEPELQHCCTIALQNDFGFLHLLKGWDGFSINYASKTKDSIALLD